MFITWHVSGMKLLSSMILCDIKFWLWRLLHSSCILSFNSIGLTYIRDISWHLPSSMRSMQMSKRLIKILLLIKFILCKLPLIECDNPIEGMTLISSQLATSHVPVFSFSLFCIPICFTLSHLVRPVVFSHLPPRL